MQKTNIKLSLGTDNNLIIISTDEETQTITLDMVNKLCGDFFTEDPDIIEWIYSELCGDFVVCCITTAKGQGGLVFVWNIKEKCFVHYSNGEFAIKATIYKHNVYVLRLVSYWGVKPHLCLDYCPLGTLTINNKSSEITLDEQIAYNLTEDPDDYVITFDNSYPAVKIKND